MLKINLKTPSFDISIEMIMSSTTYRWSVHQLIHHSQSIKKPFETIVKQNTIKWPENLITNSRVLKFSKKIEIVKAKLKLK